VKKNPSLVKLLQIMALLRSPEGCPWDRQQNHRTLRYHAVEEVYELMDAIEAGDDHEMIEELGDLLLQVVFHCQLARERKAFDFDTVVKRLCQKLVRRHPHVFGDSKTKSIAAIWAQWDKIKQAEKSGTQHERRSALDGIPRHLPALLRAEKLNKKARKAGLIPKQPRRPAGKSWNKTTLVKMLFDLTAYAQHRGWSAEAMLRQQSLRLERSWRRQEKPARNRGLS
jgi:uncharacterized protein YabN with tetrapyrrole methylase and pyrophosphatase domain